jgi:hypothetical protein
MNHPNSEEWLRFIDNETPAAETRRLAEHLHSCGECSEQVAAWRRSIGRLQRLDTPAAPRLPRWRWGQKVVRLGLAASLALGGGFGLGWITAPSSRVPDAAIMAEMRRDLRRELALDLLAAVSRNAGPGEDATQRQLRQGVQAVLAQSLEGLATRQLELSQATRSEDRRETARALAEVQSRFSAEYLSLRRDLETLASTADADINLARLQISQLAVNKVPSNQNQ